MNSHVERMRTLLEAQDFSGFLAAYAEYSSSGVTEEGAFALTQRLLPPLLQRAFDEERVSAPAVVQLYRLVREGRLIVVDNDILHAINLRIDAAMRALEPAVGPVPALRLFKDDPTPGRARRAGAEVPTPCQEGGTAQDGGRIIPMTRVAIVSTFSVHGWWSMSDAFDFRKNVCASNQEREFLMAVRQYFPSMHAYPNQPLRNFIDIDKLEERLPVKVRKYAWSAVTDVLLCTPEEDPVCGIELDSVHHDTEEAAERDELKNAIFKLAGMPLVRIRADDSKAVRAEDFYDLLVAQAEVLQSIRPRRLRPRRSHDHLVPTKAYARVSPAGS